MREFLSFKVTTFIFLFPAIACSQGLLHGVVTDSLTHEKLIGINVIVEGTSLGAATDIEGQYRIVGIPETPAKIKFSCVGYKTKIINVDFSKNKDIQLDGQLVQAILQGQTVVITAQMRGQVAAINQQISSNTIVNVVSEEKIKELPDANAAEAIGRLPGVSLIRSGGEATQIVLRGLSSKFSNITIDGIKIPATDPNTRDVDLSLISQGALSGIELYKTLTPDQDGDAIAGTVNLVTRKAPSERTITFDLGGDYNRLMKSANQYDFGVRYGERFFNDILGVQLQGNLERKIRSKEDISYDYVYYKPVDNPNSLADVDYRMGPFTVDFTDEIRTRKGGQAIFDINTPDSGFVKLSGLYNSTGRNIMLYDRVYPGISGGGGYWDYNYRDRELNISTANTSLQGHNHITGLDVDWGASYADSRTTNPFDFALKFTDPSGAIAGGVPSGRDHPEINIIPYATNDFSAAACSTAVYRSMENFDKERTAHLDVSKEYTVSDMLAGDLKGGVKYKDRTRWMNDEELDDNNYLHSFSPIGVDTVRMEESRFADYYYHRSGSRPDLTDFIDYPVASRNLLGLYKMTPLIDVDALKLWYDLTKKATVSGASQYGSNAEAELTDYDVTERVSSGYLMNTFDIGQAATVIAGVRVEKESDDYLAKFTTGGISNIGIRLTASDPIRDSTTAYGETVVLPNLQVTLRPNDFLTFRLAAYKALARPDYNLRMPTFFAYGDTILLGNPNLKDTKAWNYELNTQVHSTTIGLISVSGFYKVIDDLYHQMNKVLIDSQLDSLLSATGMTWQSTQPFKSIIGRVVNPEISIPYNSDRPSYAYGIEFEHQMNFGFLPGYLSNISLSYNVSVTRSETYIIGNQTFYTYDTTLVRGKPIVNKNAHHDATELKRESEGQPDLYGNAAIGYDIGGFSARLSIFYQDSYVQQYSGDGQTDVVVDPFTKLDLALKQQITQIISLYLNINNLTNKEETTSFKNILAPWSIPRSAELYGTTADLGLRINL